jgi:hypothetical protein
MSNPQAYEEYIGDGVHASFDGYQIWLRAAGDCGCHENRIALEPAVYASLVRYRNSLYARIQDQIEGASTDG